MIWRGVVGKQGLLRNPELIGKWMQVCSSHTQPARYRDGKHTEWLGDRKAMAQLVARRNHNSRMLSLSGSFKETKPPKYTKTDWHQLDRFTNQSS
ncbi:hypothetical protein EYF80_023861 [Liparis tanakae]|uniref:Uncharacterized protein n=1 Tax=Liparis tanakae TaxID=230148 RepID=A0A4Z2HJT6_9TELE|nr:hypothetical protein EYF80_023861 [Liparis tanakae]